MRQQRWLGTFNVITPHMSWVMVMRKSCFIAFYLWWLYLQLKNHQKMCSLSRKKNIISMIQNPRAIQWRFVEAGRCFHCCQQKYVIPAALHSSCPLVRIWSWIENNFFLTEVVFGGQSSKSAAGGGTGKSSVALLSLWPGCFSNQRSQKRKVSDGGAKL